MAKLIERVSGSRLLSDQKISQIVSDKALQLSQEMQEDATRILNETDIDLIKVNPKVDVYNAESSEILLFDDGIQVKGQKSQREPKAKPEEKFGSKSANKSQIQRVVTDIAMLQKTNQKFEYITAPIAQQGQDMLPFSCSGKSPDN